MGYALHLLLDMDIVEARATRTVGFKGVLDAPQLVRAKVPAILQDCVCRDQKRTIPQCDVARRMESLFSLKEVMNVLETFTKYIDVKAVLVQEVRMTCGM